MIDTSNRLFTADRLSRFSFFVWVTLLAYIVLDIIPSFFNTYVLPLGLIFLFEAILFSLLWFAWKQYKGNINVGFAFVLIMIFLFRIVYRLSLSSTLIGGIELWGFRAATIHQPFIGLFWFGIGTLGLHPIIFVQLKDWANQTSQLNHSQKRIYDCFGLFLIALLFWLLRSSHISRDGMDWILRSTKPVWHLYMREPLTIGLHRLAYLTVRPFFSTMRDITLASKILPFLSIMAGVWSTYWFWRLIRTQWQDKVDRILALLLALASGGWIMLYFGHIEVYPILIAGLLPAFYYAQRYLGGLGSITSVAIWFSIAFLLHLSAGWLLPAFILLPFLGQERMSPLKDIICFVAIFVSIQAVFWLGLLVFFYDASLTALLARLHETFNVGPDRAMFLPPSAWFNPERLLDLLNELIYLSFPCLILIPLAFVTFIRHKNKQGWFWFLLCAGYSIYFFLWNPDRGFPEDWDLFSPLVPLYVLFILHTLLNSSKRRKEWLYLVSVGMISYSLTQILFHFLIPFSRLP